MDTLTTTNIPPVAAPPRGYLIRNGNPVGHGVVDITEAERANLHRELDQFLNKAHRPTDEHVYFHLGVVTDHHPAPHKVIKSI